MELLLMNNRSNAQKSQGQIKEPAAGFTAFFIASSAFLSIGYV